jgi:hypothetical protein
LRSSISFSVTTVMDCGMSRSSWLPLPMVVVVARTESLPCGRFGGSRTVTGARLRLSRGYAGAAVWAQLPMESASIMAPRGSMAGPEGSGSEARTSRPVVVRARAPVFFFAMKASSECPLDGLTLLKEAGWRGADRSVTPVNWLADENNSQFTSNANLSHQHFGRRCGGATSRSAFGEGALHHEVGSVLHVAFGEALGLRA